MRTYQNRRPRSHPVIASFYPRKLRCGHARSGVFGVGVLYDVVEGVGKSVVQIGD